MLKKMGPGKIKGGLLQNMNEIKDYIKTAMVNVRKNVKFIQGGLLFNKEDEKTTLKAIIEGIDPKERRKITDSRGKLGNESEILRDLAYASPYPDSKLKKSIP